MYRQQIPIAENINTEEAFMKSFEIAQALDRKHQLEEREKKRAEEEELEKLVS